MRARESKTRDRLERLEGRIGVFESRRGNIMGGMTGDGTYNRREDHIWYPVNVYTWHLWLTCFPDIEKLVIPYRTAKFTQTWKYLMTEGQAAKTIAKLAESLTLVKPWEYGSEKYMPNMRARVARDLKNFLHLYQEGALVMLSLLDCAGKRGWRGRQDSNISLSLFPGIEGKDTVEVWSLVEKLRVLMREALGERKFSSLFIKYLDDYYGYSYEELDEKLNYSGFQTSVARYPIYDYIKYREDVKSLEALVEKRWDWFVAYYYAAGENWKKLSTLVRCYVLCRAADSLSFGERYSSLPRSAFAPYEELVGALVALSKDTQARLDEAEEKEQAAKDRKRIEEKCAEKVRDISYIPPTVLESRALNAVQIMAVKNACMEEIKYSPKEVCEVAATIDEFARFCVLLAKPENHIKVRSAQYVEKPVRARAEIDMVNEISRELVNLPRYTAYARVVGEKDGKALFGRGKYKL
jgi:hypothetical protein